MTPQQLLDAMLPFGNSTAREVTLPDATSEPGRPEPGRPEPKVESSRPEPGGAADQLPGLDGLKAAIAQGEEAILEQFTTLLGIAIENRRLYLEAIKQHDSERERDLKLARLREIVEATRSELDQGAGLNGQRSGRGNDPSEDEPRRPATRLRHNPMEDMASVSLRLEAVEGRLRGEDQRRIMADVRGATVRFLERLRSLLSDAEAADLFRPAPPVAPVPEAGPELAVAADGGAAQADDGPAPDGGFAGALRERLDDLSAEHGINGQVEGRLTVEPPDDVRAIAERIIGQILDEVKGSARIITVGIEASWDSLLVRVRHDGRELGLDEGREDMEDEPLSPLAALVEAAGGWLESQTVPGIGTTVQFWLPSAEAEEAAG